MAECCICHAPTEENAPVLTVSGYGIPRCLCPRCASVLDRLTLGRDPEDIRAAAEELSALMTAGGTEDSLVTGTVEQIFTTAAERAEAIKAGTYDFSADVSGGEEEDETAPESAEDSVPEELRETEEDKEMDRREEESERRFDKVLNYVWLGVLILLVFAIGYMLLRRFVL